MFRLSVKTIKGWTIVQSDSVKHFDLFDEALEEQTKTGGHLMTTTYYNTDYSQR
jgi:hypothetical protein